MKSLQLILSHMRYFAPAWVFSSLNIITGTWVLYLPHIKDKFALNDGEVGTALFCLAIGILVAIACVPTITKRYGVGNATKYGIMLFAISFILPLLADSYVLLCMSLFLTGSLSGFTDMSMNSLVSIIEKEDDTFIMSATHGFFSLGGVIGAGVGSILLILLDQPALHMSIIALLVVLSNYLLSKNYSHIRQVEISKEDQKSKWSSLKLLFGLSLVAFLVLCNEGAVEHWSNIYMAEVVHIDLHKAGFGFIAFSLAMTIGRFLGDQISKRIGSVKIIVLGSLMATLGYCLILMTSIYLAVFGFAVLGLGLSVIIPEIFRLAGQTKGVEASVGISLVSGIGFLGFLLGPVFLGFISNLSSLTMSYVFLLTSMFLSAIIAIFQRHKIY